MKENKKYVIGIDGGGSKTATVLADLQGKILNRVKTGPSNVNKIGLDQVVNNISEALNQVSQKYPKNKIAFIYVALAGGIERDQNKKKEIKNQLLKNQKLTWLFSKNLLVDSDLLAAFRSGTEQEQGVLLIAGAGSITAGWNKGKEVIVGGWDYLLGDNGSGFWLGQKALQVICSSLDGLIPKTLLQDIFFQKLRVKTQGDLIRKIYQSKEMVKTIASLAPLLNLAAEKGDDLAKNILVAGGDELAIRANLVIEKLNFKNIKFPLVLAGSVFKSKIILAQVKKRIKKFAPQVNFIQPKQEPVIGAVKLAIEHVCL